MPEYVELFAPALHRDRYRAFVSPRPLDEVAETIATDVAFLHPPGAWVRESLDAGDAFGESGSYNRARLAMLYKGQPVHVARGPRAAGSRVVESWTLLSPYPAASFAGLERGTLLLIAAMPTK